VTRLFSASVAWDLVVFLVVASLFPDETPDARPFHRPGSGGDNDNDSIHGGGDGGIDEVSYSSNVNTMGSDVDVNGDSMDGSGSMNDATNPLVALSTTTMPAATSAPDTLPLEGTHIGSPAADKRHAAKGPSLHQGSKSVGAAAHDAEGGTHAGAQQRFGFRGPATLLVDLAKLVAWACVALAAGFACIFGDPPPNTATTSASASSAVRRLAAAAAARGRRSDHRPLEEQPEVEGRERERGEEGEVEEEDVGAGERRPKFESDARCDSDDDEEGRIIAAESRHGTGIGGSDNIDDDDDDAVWRLILGDARLWWFVATFSACALFTEVKSYNDARAAVAAHSQEKM